MYFIPTLMALLLGYSQRRYMMTWFIVGFIFMVLIGFRHDVGGDWTNYILHYNAMDGKTWQQAISNGDPAHQFLNWLSFQWGLGTYGVNVVYAIIFMVGLVKFSRLQTYPWLAMVVSVPYLITVVAMGYSRQGVAIGLFLLAVTYLDKRKFKTYVALIFFAALFHKSAMLLLPLGIFLYGKGMTVRILMLIPILYGTWDLLLAKEQDALWHNYVEADMQSQGAIIRVIMNLIPSLLLLVYRKEWQKNYSDYAFWFWIAIGSLLSVGLVGLSSTAVDRVALYFIPIQLVVFSRLPLLARKHFHAALIKFVIILAYALVLFVWLNFAVHSSAWIPYQNLLFMDLI